ncbi:hypothetical protein CDAR_165421 [Caerostris darwini]|nr:hypothetical protein CDAR_165421 [Caerostris darwini]
MRDYQIDGYEWLKTLFENGVNGILADEMGLGKTIQSIAFIAHLIEMGVSGPFFVCGPLSTVPNWYNEFQMFAPDIPVMIYHGDKAERQELRKQIYKRVRKNGVYCFPVIITSYQIALIDTLKLASITWKLMIIDEAHRIKNYQCKLIEALKTYNVVHRLLLTGTPLQNNLSELWSLLNFILPEIFDDLKIFQSWFDITRLTQHGATQEIIAQEQEKQIVSTIHQILTPFLLRRTKADVELCLPSKKVVLVKAPMTQLQQKYYSGVLNESIRKFFEKENKNAIEVVDEHPKRKSKKTSFFGCENSEDDFTIEKIPSSNSSFLIENSEINLKLTNIMMCLRKICCHPYMISYPLDDSYQYLVDENLVKTSGKLLVLDNLLPHLKKRGHKVLIFSQFVTLLHILEDYCTFRNYKFTKLYGKMHLEERERQLKLFNEDSSVFLFLISTRAGGLGINLTSADTVILYDTDWNPQADLQAQDRCHRIGQKKPVVVYRLIIPNTVDEKILTYAETKRKLEKAIIQKGRFSSKNGISKVQRAITKEELLELLESSDVNGFINADNFVIPPKELESILNRSDMV